MTKHDTNIRAVASTSDINKPVNQIYKKGMMVKIRRAGERFWNKIVSVNGNTIHATVANDLVVYRKKFGDRIMFSKDDVIDIEN